MLCGTVPDHEQVLQLDGPVRLDHDPRRAPHVGDPRRQLVGICHRRRQAHEGHVQGRAEDDLLPDAASVGVLEVVNLVQHDIAQVRKAPGLGVDHVAQDLGRHDDDRRLAVYGVVPGQQAHLPGAVLAAEVPVLLIREGLYGRGVEDLRPFREGEVDGVLGDDRLARARRGADEDRLAVVEEVEGVELESVKRIRVVREELLAGHQRGRQAPSCAPSRARHLPSTLPITIEAS